MNIYIIVILVAIGVFLGQFIPFWFLFFSSIIIYYIIIKNSNNKGLESIPIIIAGIIIMYIYI